MKVALSYKVRRESLETMGDYFRRLMTGIDPLKPLYLPLDVPDRQDYLDRINSELNLDLTTDWSAVGSFDQESRLTGTDHDIMADFMDEHSVFFHRFGYEC